MSCYAQIDKNNVVVNIIESSDADIANRELDEFTYVAYHIDTPVGAGGMWHPDIQAFSAPQPFPSWTLDNATAQWISPVPYPENPEQITTVDGLVFDRVYYWNEELQAWELPT